VPYRKGQLCWSERRNGPSSTSVGLEQVGISTNASCVRCLTERYGLADGKGSYYSRHQTLELANGKQDALDGRFSSQARKKQHATGRRCTSASLSGWHDGMEIYQLHTRRTTLLLSPQFLQEASSPPRLSSVRSYIACILTAAHGGLWSPSLTLGQRAAPPRARRRWGVGKGRRRRAQTQGLSAGALVPLKEGCRLPVTESFKSMNYWNTTLTLHQDIPKSD